MAVTLKNGNTFNKQKFVIPGESLYTIDFGEMMPNFYRLNNMGDVTLYCSTGALPSQNMYDFKANPCGLATFTEPKYSSKLYVYNPINKDVPIILFYWADEFDPSFLAMGEISLNNEGVVETDGIVKGFSTELPAGDNIIGKVELTGSWAQSNNNILTMLREDVATDVINLLIQIAQNTAKPDVEIQQVNISGYETQNVTVNDGWLGNIISSSGTDLSKITVSHDNGVNYMPASQWNLICSNQKARSIIIANDDGSVTTVQFEVHK